MINLVCPIKPHPIISHKAENSMCTFAQVPVVIHPHEYSKGADPIGKVCGVFMCPYLADEHPVVGVTQVNG